MARAIPGTRDLHEVRETDGLRPRADFNGLECRWQGVKSRKDHKVCLLVKSVSESEEEKRIAAVRATIALV